MFRAVGLVIELAGLGAVGAGVDGGADVGLEFGDAVVVGLLPGFELEACVTAAVAVLGCAVSVAWTELRRRVVGLLLGKANFGWGVCCCRGRCV
jgi:hypothetical protein